MKRYISICILWMFCLTILGQSNGYGFNPINPPNPNKPVVSNKKYELKITSSGGGSINNSSSANYEVGENIYLSASPQTGYKFKCWLIGDSVISISQWYYFTMPAKKTEIKAEFVYEPDSPNNPNIIKLSYKVTVKALSQGGTVYCSNEKVKEGTTTYVSATPYTGYKFAGWYLDGKLVSNSSHYYFEMEGRQMDFTAQFEVAPFNPDNPINPNNNPNNQPLYIIEYKIDGELCHIGQIPAGATIAAISTPVKEGHTFSGWNGLPTTMPSSNITVNGTFTVNYYNLSYVVDGETVATNKIAYGSAINLIDVAEKEGHTFSGWGDVPKTMPAKDITLSGTYQVNSYKVIYKVDDVAYDSTEVTYGSPVTLIAAPEKEGHTFSGWSEAPETMPAKDITISGTFSVNSYKITWKIDGEEKQVDTVNYGTAIVPPTSFEKEGYQLYWSNKPESMPAMDIVVDGTYSLRKYLVTYIANDSTIATDSIAFGSKIEQINAPDKEGYTFIGWAEVPETMPAKDIVLTAKYSVNKYTIKYVIGEDVIETVTVEYGSTIEFIEEPTKEGYTFSGWSCEYTTMPAKDIVVNGSYNAKSYTITYKVDDKEYKTENVAFGTKIQLIEAPTKEGYTFSGWSEAPETMPAKDITISGTFSVNSYKVTYKVDGTEYKTVNVNYGEKIVLIDAPAKDGFTFSGWTDAPETMPAKDITISGTFGVNSYKVTYMVDGKEHQSVSLAYGSAITLIEALTKEGYTFSGWSEAPETMPAKDIVINGSFTVNSYKVTYMVDGANYKTVDVNFGEKIELIATPIKNGFTFSGWSEAPETMPAKDIVINGSFGVNSYKVTYMVDGKEYQSVSLAYGSAITLIDAPTKEGHTFSGWSEAPETMPAKDITISGTFSVNSYKITYMVDGTEFKTVNVNFGEKIELITAPTKDGFTFSGWTDAPDVMPAKDIVINGSFLTNAYSVTYMVDGKEYRTIQVSYGAKIELIGAPAKEGHTFCGWGEVPESMPAKDIVLTAEYSVNNYAIIYIIDEDIIETDTVAYGSSITLIDVPTKEGHTFSGWSEAPKTMPAKDITISGTFSVNYYTLTYIVDGDVYKEEQVAYGSEIVLIDAPTKEDYIFSGWSDYPATMPAENVTITGSFVHTSISGISADAIVKISGNSITLSGANNNTIVIYTTNGALVEKIDNYAGEEIQLDKGIYIISIDGKVVKIRL